NSSLIPWLLCVASIHTTLTQRKSGAFVKTNFILSLLTFITVLYSTFLTRSGVLGDTSVHSFVDPGMWVYWLLLICIFVFAAIGFGLLFVRMKEMPKVPVEHSFFSREFALFLGAFALSFVALFVVIGTSSPIITSILKGKASAVEISYYVKTNLPLGIAITFLSGLGQLLWWKHSKAGSLIKSLLLPLSLSLATSAIVFVIMGTEEFLILLFAFCAAFSLFSNLQVGYGIFKGSPKFVGGSIAHIGVALMCLGFVTSERYDDKATLSLERGKAVESLGYKLTYVGYTPIDNERYAFNVEVQRGELRKVVRPTMHFSSQTNSTLRHPDLINFIDKDFYVSPVSIETPGENEERSITLDKGEVTEIGGLKVRFVSYDFSDAAREAMMEGKDFVVTANLEATDNGKAKALTLKMTSSPAGPKFIPESLTASGNRVFEFTLARIVPSQSDQEKSKVEFTVKLPTDKNAPKREETLVVEASVKPMINLVWMGTVTLVVGFLLTIVRRSEEAKMKRERWQRE
ncbi:MAG: cytochrome c-type biogenesis CcmF C-terminal domain-containing protein, partial [Bacteroidota bacterium]